MHGRKRSNQTLQSILINKGWSEEDAKYIEEVNIEIGEAFKRVNLMVQM